MYTEVRLTFVACWLMLALRYKVYIVIFILFIYWFIFRIQSGICINYIMWWYLNEVVSLAIRYLDAIIRNAKPLFIYMIIMVIAHHLIVFLLRNIFHAVLSNAGNDHYWIIKTKPQVWMKIYSLKMHSIFMYQMIERRSWFCFRVVWVEINVRENILSIRGTWCFYENYTVNRFYTRQRGYLKFHVTYVVM